MAISTEGSTTTATFTSLQELSKTLPEDSAPVGLFEVKHNFIAWLNGTFRPTFVSRNLTPLYQLPNNVNCWSVEHVRTFVATLGFESTASLMVENNVDGVALLLMRKQDFVRRLDLAVGPAIRLHSIIQKLQGFMDEEKD